VNCMRYLAAAALCRRAALRLVLLSAYLLLGHSVLRSPPTPAIYTLSLHDALPISAVLLRDGVPEQAHVLGLAAQIVGDRVGVGEDRKSTRLNSSHVKISYAVFCLKKKKNIQQEIQSKTARRRIKHHRAAATTSPTY